MSENYSGQSQIGQERRMVETFGTTIETGFQRISPRFQASVLAPINKLLVANKFNDLGILNRGFIALGPQA